MSLTLQQMSNRVALHINEWFEANGWQRAVAKKDFTGYKNSFGMNGIGDCLPTKWIIMSDIPLFVGDFTEQTISKGEEYIINERLHKVLDEAVERITVSHD
jgi:hypothetical protein